MSSDVDIIVDASSLYARAFFAAQRAQADPVIAGIRSVLGVIHHTGATRAVFCWDGKAKSKKVREEKPEGYDDHRTSFQEWVSWLWDIPQLKSDLHEADDLVASIVYSERVAPSVFIVSGDKDLQQLIDCRRDSTVQYYCLNKKIILDKDSVVEKWGVKRPSHIAIALAILGDQADGIGGIKGWGPAKVSKLFESVHGGMTFEEAVLVIDAQVPDALKQTFYDCLEATILHQDASIASGPKKLEWRHPSELDDAGVAEVKSQYSSGYYGAMPVSDDLI